MAGWNADNAAGPVGQGAVTLVEGSSFCISLQNGDIFPHHPHGVFHQDTRILSPLVPDRQRPAAGAAGAWTPAPYQGTVRRQGRACRRQGRQPADGGTASRELGAGILEDITVRNYALVPAACEVALSVDTDFADLFEVKDGRFHRQWEQTRRSEDGAVTIEAVWQGVRKGVVVRAPEADVGAEGLLFRTVIPAHGEWTVRVTVSPVLDGRRRPAPARPHHSRTPSRRRTGGSRPGLRPSRRPGSAIRPSSEPSIAATMTSAPCASWTRSIRTGWSWPPGRRGSWRCSAGTRCWPPSWCCPSTRRWHWARCRPWPSRQGAVVDPLTEEQPGRILHEVRLGVGTGLALGGKSAYYGTADATPLFVTLLGRSQPLGTCRGGHRRAAAARGPRPGLDPGLRRPRRRRIRRVRAAQRPGPHQPGLEGLLGRDQFRRRPHRRGPHRVVRGAGLRLQRVHRPRLDGLRRRRPRLWRPSSGTVRNG